MELWHLSAHTLFTSEVGLLLPIVLSRKHACQQELLGGLQGNMPPKWTRHLVLSDRQVCKWCGLMERTRGRRSWAWARVRSQASWFPGQWFFFLIPLIGEVNSFYHEEKWSECQIRGLVSPVTNVKNHSHTLPVTGVEYPFPCYLCASVGILE